MEIIQTEEYLTAADIELIAYKQNRKKRSPESFVDPSAILMPFSLAMGAMGLASRHPKKRPHPYYNYQNDYYHHPYKMQHYKPYKHHHHYVEVKEVPVVPPLIPLTVPQPGEPGGGAPPSAGDEEVRGLVPRGLRPVSVFPPYLFPRTVPAKCVIWAEPDPPLDLLEEPRKKLMGKKSFLEQVKDFFGLDKLIPKPRGKYVRVVEVPAFERRYGFRCKVTLVDKQQCQVGVTCDEFGNRLIRKRKRKKRQFAEFFSEAPPYCLTELSPLGCTPAI